MPDPQAVKLLSTLRDMILKEMSMHSLNAVWIKHWPDYCEYCDASGVYDHQNDQKYAESMWIPGSNQSECPNCVENGYCPRCGEIVAFENLKPRRLYLLHHG